MRRESNRAGFSSVDLQLLSSIHAAPGIGVSDLADLEKMSRPAMSAHVKRLMAQGLVERMEDETEADRRHVGLAVTRGGQTFLRANSGKESDWLADRIAELGREERAALLRAMKPLRHILSAADAA